MKKYRYCLNCGQKFYPNSYSAYPQDHYAWSGPGPRGMLEIPAEHKHFHSLNCMKEWLAKNHHAFHLLLTSMGNNDRNSETINQIERN
jgi:hypothetical protein